MKGSGPVNRVELECQVLCAALRQSWVRYDKVGAFTSIRELSHLFPDLLPPPEERNGSNKTNYYDVLSVRPQSGLNAIMVGYFRRVRKFLKEKNAKDHKAEYNTILNAGFILRKPRLRLSHDLVVARRWLYDTSDSQVSRETTEIPLPSSIHAAAIQSSPGSVPPNTVLPPPPKIAPGPAAMDSARTPPASTSQAQPANSVEQTPPQPLRAAQTETTRPASVPPPPPFHPSIMSELQEKTSASTSQQAASQSGASARESPQAWQWQTVSSSQAQPNASGESPVQATPPQQQEAPYAPVQATPPQQQEAPYAPVQATPPQQQEAPYTPVQATPPQQEAPYAPVQATPPQQQEAPYAPVQATPQQQEAPYAPVQATPPQQQEAPYAPVQATSPQQEAPYAPVQATPQQQEAPYAPVQATPQQQEAPYAPVQATPQQQEMPYAPVQATPQQQEAPYAPVQATPPQQEMPSGSVQSSFAQANLDEPATRPYSTQPVQSDPYSQTVPATGDVSATNPEVLVTPSSAHVQTDPASASSSNAQKFVFDESQLRKPEVKIDIPPIIKLMEAAHLITSVEVQALKAQIQLAPNIAPEQLVLNAGYATRQEISSLHLAQDLLARGRITMAQFQVAMYDERTMNCRMAESLQNRGWLETETKNPFEG